MTAESTMSDHAESVIAAALSEQGAAYPRCGASLIMDALRAARITIVEPAAMVCDRAPSLTVRWADGQVVVHAKGSGVVRTLLDDSRHTPDDARELGAALLAAAEYAEGQR